jgi:hypothetical protein
LEYFKDQVKEFLSTVYETKKKHGNVNGDQNLMGATVLAALAPNVAEGADWTLVKDMAAPSHRATLTLIGVKKKSGTSRLKKAMVNQNKLFTSKAANQNARWVNICQRRYKGQKVSEPTRLPVIHWVVKHENVINSPICYETLLIKAPGCNQKTQVGKLLLDISVRELHNKMVSDVIDGGLANARNLNGKVTVSDTTLRRIIKQDIPQLRRASSRHKQMCGCVTCITAHML